jgi:hypothetical protein
MLVGKQLLQADRTEITAITRMQVRTRVSAETPFNAVHTVGAALAPCPLVIVLGLRPGLRRLGAISCQLSLSASSGPVEDGLDGPSMPARMPV